MRLRPSGENPPGPALPAATAGSGNAAEAAKAAPACMTFLLLISVPFMAIPFPWPPFVSQIEPVEDGCHVFAARGRKESAKPAFPARACRGRGALPARGGLRRPVCAGG